PCQPDTLFLRQTKARTLSVHEQHVESADSSEPDGRRAAQPAGSAHALDELSQQRLVLDVDSRGRIFTSVHDHDAYNPLPGRLGSALIAIEKAGMLAAHG